ncbi:MAG: tRNA (adenosine(37)-N6)-dimethylallyltransferase MiaA [Lachnospiraceae bacterium]
MKQPLIILTGPTAVGKTGLSIELAKRINGAIVSADSMQVYRGMDIGSAKIKEEEKQGIKHYLIDILDPEEDFNVVQFQARAKAALEEIYADRKCPIVVGGTGFYIQALLYNIDFTKSEKEDGYREALEQTAKEKGADFLHEELKKVDPKAAEEIHPNNVKRVIRALEFYHESGKKISEHNEQEKEKESFFNSAYFVLNDDREKMYQRIDQRVDQMLQDGLIQEVKALKERGFHSSMVSMQGLGYKELFEYLEGSCTLDEAVYKIKRDTRHFAKRQITWFRREKDVIWLDKSAYESNDTKLLEELMLQLKKRGIIE